MSAGDLAAQDRSAAIRRDSVGRALYILDEWQLF